MKIDCTLHFLQLQRRKDKSEKTRLLIIFDGSASKKYNVWSALNHRTTLKKEFLLCSLRDCYHRWMSYFPLLKASEQILI